MFNNRGTTLIEALFSFFVYVTVLVMFVSLMSTLNTSALRLADKHNETHDDRTLLSYDEKQKTLIQDILS